MGAEVVGLWQVVVKICFLRNEMTGLMYRPFSQSLSFAPALRLLSRDYSFHISFWQVFVRPSGLFAEIPAASVRRQ
jgi:hypothetical protein